MIKLGDEVRIMRDKSNQFNSNNFIILTCKDRDFRGAEELCNAMAPLYDEGRLVFESAKVCFVEPISKRSRHARKAVLFIELRAILSDEFVPG